MWAWLRKTARRGRAGVPWIFFRIRSWSRFRTSSLVFTFIHRPPGMPASFRAGTTGARGRPGLARLLLQDLAQVADPLLLVGVGLPEAADLRRHLAHLLAVDTGDGDPGLLVHRDLDPFRDR